jgi:ATP-dependent Clp protease adapter protein ClpS
VNDRERIFRIMSDNIETESETVEEQDIVDFPNYRILIWNDNTSDFQMVVQLIMVVFAYTEMEAYEITTLIHKNMNATVWSGSYEVGELRLEQCHKFILENNDYLKELKVTLEED